MPEARKAFFAFPSKHGEFRIETTAMLLESYAPMMYKGWHHPLVRGLVGDSFIQQARCLLIGEFLSTDCTDLFFVDDDTAAEAGAIQKFLECPVDFVAASYPVRDDSNRRYPIKFIDDKKPDIDPETGLMEVRNVPLGFARFKREGLERLVEQHAADWFKFNGILAWKVCDVNFMPTHTGWQGEDYSLCDNWRKSGQKVWLDPKINMAHVGEKVFRGCLWDDLKAMEPQDTAEQIRETLKVVQPAFPRNLPQGAQQNAIELKWLLKHIAGAESILEVGSCIGESLKVMSKHCVKGAKLRSIDLGKVNMGGDFETAGYLRKAIDGLKADGFDADVMISDSRAAEAIAWAEKNGPYDFVYIDGDHSYEGVKADFDNYGHLAPVVGFHDIGHMMHDVVRFWGELKAAGYETQEMIASDMGTGVVFMDKASKMEAAE